MAYSVSRPTRRWKTSGLLATVRHYRVAQIGFGLSLAVGSNSGQSGRQRPRVDRRADRLMTRRRRGIGGRRGLVLVHFRDIRTRGEYTSPKRERGDQHKLIRPSM